MAQVIIDINANDNVSKVIAQIQRNLDRLQRNANRNTNAVSGGRRGGGDNPIGDVSFKSLLGANLASQAIITLASSIVNLGKASLEQARLMEQARKRLDFAFGGRYAGGGAMEKAGGFAAQLGLSKESTIESYSKFAAAASESGLTTAETEKVFQGTSKAIAAMGLSAEDSKGVFLAFSQIISKGKASSEELRQQLGERLPGAMALAAKASKMTMPEFVERLEKGQIEGKKLVLQMTELFEKQYGKAAEENLESLEGQINNLDNSFFDLKTAIADAFGPATLSAIATLGAGISKLTTLTKIFFGESMSGRGKLKAAAFSNTKEGKELAAAVEAGDRKTIEERRKQAQKNLESNLGALGASISGTQGLKDIIGERLSGKLQKEIEKNQRLQAINAPGSGLQTQEAADALAASNQNLLDLTTQAQKKLEGAPRQSALTKALMSNPMIANSSIGGMVALGGAISGSTANEETLSQVDKLIQSVQDAGVSADAWNTAAKDLQKVKDAAEANAALSPKGKAEKLKTDFHTPKIININILSGNGSSLISGGVSTTIQSTQTDANSIKTQLQTMIEQSMIDILTDTGTSLSRIATSQ
jgi:tape measure domain-containing protein